MLNKGVIMYIIGLGGSLHDFSACLIKNGEIVVAIEEERITRVKHAIDKKILQDAIINNQVWKLISQIDKNTLKQSVEYCLEYEGISMNDVEYVITTDSNAYLPYIKTLDNVITIRHHMAHAASAYYTSGFDEAAILVVDGRGSSISVNNKIGYESVSFVLGKGNRLKVLDRIIDYSVGHFYTDFTLGIGFDILEEGKTMGLSSYGKDTYVHTFRECFELQENGKIMFRLKDSEIREKVRKIVIDSNNDFQVRADLAFAVQKLTEDIMMHYIKYIKELTGVSKLCIAGGVGLNSVANGVIYDSNIFEEIFIFPACGDNGLSIGAAMYGAYYLGRSS